MLAYAVSRRQVAARQSSPNAMLIIVSAHVAAIAVVMSARMDLPQRIFHPPTVVELIKVPPPPPPNVAQSQPQHPALVAHIDNRVPIVDPTPPETVHIDTGDAVNPADAGAIGGGAAVLPDLPTRVTPVHHDARLLTPPSELKPPYPQSKLLSEEEATLTLWLTIDRSGRVVAVEPVGKADRAFLDSARRHLMAHWRFQPASDDGRAVVSSTMITLQFRLDG